MSDVPKDHPQVVKYIAGMRAWRAEFEALRPVLLRAGLDAHAGSNVVIFQPFKELCALLFFKGALLNDPEGALKEQGENTRTALRLEFRSVADVTAAKATITALVKDAIRVEEAGLSVPKPDPGDDGPYPEELDWLLDVDPAFSDAWQRCQAIQHPRRTHRARHTADLGRLRDARLKVITGRFARTGRNDRRVSFSDSSRERGPQSTLRLTSASASAGDSELTIASATVRHTAERHTIGATAGSLVGPVVGSRFRDFAGIQKLDWPSQD
jgi:uncharacterized protein YdeI (YjbR/CyaY-like superfamily)